MNISEFVPNNIFQKRKFFKYVDMILPHMLKIRYIKIVLPELLDSYCNN